MSQYVIDVTQETFQAEVEHAGQPVFIDFWAPWCGPCLAMAPMFEDLAKTYQGRVKFVKIDTDVNRDLSTRFAIRSIPALLLIKDGQAVERSGQDTKAKLSALLDRHLSAAQAALSPAATAAKRQAAFHADEALRQATIARLRGHIEAGQIVAFGAFDPEQGKFNVNAAAVHSADPQQYEHALGIPAELALLAEAVVELLLEPEALADGARDGEDRRYSFAAGTETLPIEWLQQLPLGGDLGAVSPQFIAWLLRDLVAPDHPLTAAASSAARGAAHGIADLHGRLARDEAPTAAEWTAARALAIDLLGGESGISRDVAACAEAVSWPQPDTGRVPRDAAKNLFDAFKEIIRRQSFTDEDWQQLHHARVACTEAMQERKKQPYTRDDLINLPEFTMYKDILARADAHWARQATTALGLRLHAGLLASLRAVVPA